MRRELVGGPHDGRIVDIDSYMIEMATCEDVNWTQVPDSEAALMPVKVRIDLYRAADKFDPGDEETGRTPAKYFLAVHEGSYIRE